MSVATRTLADVFFSFALPDRAIWQRTGHSMAHFLLDSRMPGAEMHIHMATFFGPHVIIGVQPPNMMNRSTVMLGLLTEKADMPIFLQWLNSVGRARMEVGCTTWQVLEDTLPETAEPHWIDMRFACEEVHSRLLLRQRMHPQLAALTAASRVYGMHCNVMGAQMDARNRGRQMSEEQFVQWYKQKMSEL